MFSLLGDREWSHLCPYHSPVSVAPLCQHASFFSALCIFKIAAFFPPKRNWLQESSIYLSINSSTKVLGDRYTLLNLLFVFLFKFLHSRDTHFSEPTPRCAQRSFFSVIPSPRIPSNLEDGVLLLPTISLAR